MLNFVDQDNTSWIFLYIYI